MGSLVYIGIVLCSPFAAWYQAIFVLGLQIQLNILTCYLPQGESIVIQAIWCKKGGEHLGELHLSNKQGVPHRCRKEKMARRKYCIICVGDWWENYVPCECWKFKGAAVQKDVLLWRTASSLLSRISGKFIVLDFDRFGSVQLFSFAAPDEWSWTLCNPTWNHVFYFNCLASQFRSY